jgi:hypothetical protein
MNNTVKLISGAIALILSITAYTLAWVWFGWEMALIIFLAQWANNIDQRLKNNGWKD